MRTYPNYLPIIASHVDSILITMHNNPDADCVCSAFALCEAIKRTCRDIFVEVYIHEPIEKYLGPVIGMEYTGITTEPSVDKYDLIISLDTSIESRAPKDIRDYLAPVGRIYMIDHHPDGDNWGHLNFRDDSPATSAQVFGLIRDMYDDMEIPVSILSMLYMGLVGDTGNFRFSNTSAYALSVASELVKRGVRPDKLMAAQESKPVSYARLASHVLGDVVVSEGFTIAYIGQWLIQECRSSTAEASSMIDLIRNIGGRDGSILLVEDIANEDGTTVRIRFRSHNKPIDELAKQFGGGGHPMASGAKVKGHLLDVYDEVFKAAKEYFKEVA